MPTESLKLPKLHHVGVVVEDIDAAIRYYSSNFGLGPFNMIDHSRKGALIRGRPGNYRIRQAFARMGQTLLELSEVVEGEPIQKEFLQTKGEGVQHLGFVVDDLDKEIKKFEKKGFRVIQSYTPPREGIRFAFMDTAKTGGLAFELVWLPKDMKRGVPNK